MSCCECDSTTLNEMKTFTFDHESVNTYFVHKETCSNWIGCYRCGGAEVDDDLHKKTCSQWTGCRECFNEWSHKKICSKWKGCRECGRAGTYGHHSVGCTQRITCTDCGRSHGYHNLKCTMGSTNHPEWDDTPTGSDCDSDSDSDW
jgi:hypothetical protein